MLPHRGGFITNNVHTEGKISWVVIAISPRQVVVNTVLSETVEPPRPLHRILLQYCCYSRGWIVLPSETADRSRELYVSSRWRQKLRTSNFHEALKYGMELKRCFPRGEVKMRDADVNMPRNDTAAPKQIWGDPVGKCAKSRQHNAKASPGVPFGRGSALKSA